MTVTDGPPEVFGDDMAGLVIDEMGPRPPRLLRQYCGVDDPQCHVSSDHKTLTPQYSMLVVSSTVRRCVTPSILHWIASSTQDVRGPLYALAARKLIASNMTWSDTIS